MKAKKICDIYIAKMVSKIENEIRANTSKPTHARTSNTNLHGRVTHKQFVQTFIYIQCILYTIHIFYMMMMMIIISSKCEQTKCKQKQREIKRLAHTHTWNPLIMITVNQIEIYYTHIRTHSRFFDQIVLQTCFVQQGKAHSVSTAKHIDHTHLHIWFILFRIQMGLNGKSSKVAHPCAPAHAHINLWKYVIFFGGLLVLVRFVAICCQHSAVGMMIGQSSGIVWPLLYRIRRMRLSSLEKLYISVMRNILMHCLVDHNQRFVRMVCVAVAIGFGFSTSHTRTHRKNGIMIFHLWNVIVDTDNG